MSVAAALLVAGLVFDANPADGGETWQMSVVEHAFAFVNRSDAPIRIVDVTALDPAASVSVEVATIPRGGSGVVHVRQPVGLRLGISRFGFEVRTDDGAAPPQRLTLTTFVQSAYDDERPFVDFGMIERESGRTARFEVASREVVQLEFESVLDAPGFLNVVPDERPRSPGAALPLQFTIPPGAPLGFHVAAVRLRTNVPRQPEYVVGVQVGVYADVVPNEPGAGLVRLGALREGRSHQRLTRLESRSGKEFAIDGVDDPAGRVTAAWHPCDGQRKDAKDGLTSRCWQLDLRVPALPVGPFRSTVLVRIAGSADAVPLTVAGLVVPADARIDALGTLGDATDILKEAP